jgi:tetratricopeptide (TPR) repeat protein
VWERLLKNIVEISLGKWGWVGLVVLAAAVAVAPAAVLVPPLNNAGLHMYPLNLDAEVRDGYQHFNNLDFDGALTRFQRVQAAHPQDPMAAGYVLMTEIFRELYHQDLLDTTLYAHEGFLTSKRIGTEDPAARKRIEDQYITAVSLSEGRIRANSNDKDAYFARGFARSMHAAYIGMMDHSFVSGLHEAVQAKNDHVKVLQLDPQYADAKMVIGIQKFAVASLPGFLRVAAGMFGQGGSKTDGLRLLHEAAEQGTITNVESRTTLTIFLRHDARYAEALQEQHKLAVDLPHNYLIRLEEANLTKDMGQGPQAIAVYKRVIADAGKKGYFSDPRLQLAWFGLADTQRGQNMTREAAEGFLHAEEQPKCADWLKRRAELNAGEMLDLLGERTKAVAQYRLAAAGGGDQSQAGAARQFMKTAYTGK